MTRTCYVVILSNEHVKLRKCLAALWNSHPQFPASQIVLVLGPMFNTVKADAPEWPWDASYERARESIVRWQHFNQPFNFSRELNRGLAAIPEDADAFLVGDDVQLTQPATIERLAEYADENHGRCIVSPAINGRIALGNTDGDRSWASQYVPNAREHERLVQMVPFFAVYLPAETRKLVGPLDERFTDYGCLNREGRVILSDGSVRKIGEIVNKRQRVNVLSMNEKTQAIESRPVVGWRKVRGRQGQKWLKIHLKRAGRSAYSDRGSVFTPEHRIITTSGVKQAADIKPGDKIYVHERSLSPRQREFILGSMLGDGTLMARNGCRACFQVSHAQNQWDYLDLKRVILASWASESACTWTPPPMIFGKNRKRTVQQHRNLCSWNSVELADLRDQIYPNGKKTISWDWLKDVGPFGFAVFYMDDGFNADGSARICCHDFGEAGTKLVAKRLLELGIGCIIDRDSRASKYIDCDPLTIRMRMEETRAFMKLIGPFVPASMRRKVTDDAPPFNPSLWEPQDTNQAYCDEVASVNEFVPKRIWAGLVRMRYCLSVEDNGNFFTSSGLVHNSDDDDYCYRARTLGISVVVLPNISVSHAPETRESHTARWGADRFKPTGAINHQKLIEKHGQYPLPVVPYTVTPKTPEPRECNPYWRRYFEVFTVSGSAENYKALLASIRKHHPELIGSKRLHCYAGWKAEEVEGAGTDFEYIPQTPDKPFVITRENNRALRDIWGRQADAILIEDDVELTAPTFYHLAQFAEAYAGRCLVQPAIDGFRYGNVVTEPSKLYRVRVEPRHYPIICVYFPTELELLVGFYDEGFSTFGGDDSDYSMRCLSAGVLQLALPWLSVKHHYHKSVFAEHRAQDMTRSTAYYRKKWGGGP